MISVDLIPNDFASKAAGKPEHTEHYDLGRTPTKADLRSLRLRVGQKCPNCIITTTKTLTEMVRVEMKNTRGWDFISSAPSSSITFADDRIISDNLRKR